MCEIERFIYLLLLLLLLTYSFVCFVDLGHALPGQTKSGLWIPGY